MSIRAKCQLAQSRLERVWQAWRCGALGPAINRTLHQIMFYLTTKCNSRCQHCNIWSKEETRLPLEVFQRAMRAKVIGPNTWIGLEGGEFLLYPWWREALEACRGRRLEIFSNGLAVDQLVEAMKLAGYPRLALSLDGRPETYRVMRGCDGYARVLECIRQLHDKCEIWLSFTFSPWNQFEDFAHVHALCQEWGLKFGINFYSDMDYNSPREPAPGPVPYLRRMSSHPGAHWEHFYAALHNAWRAGQLCLPCLSICDRAVVYPNGDIPLCQQRYIPLGNLLRESLDEIWSKPGTRAWQRAYRDCNGCWVAFHRPWDVQVVHDLVMLVGERLAQKWQGPEFSWSKILAAVAWADTQSNE